jgi:hypothetical protein
VPGAGSVGPGFGSYFGFDRGEEGFCGGAVEAGAGTACGLSYLEALQELSICLHEISAASDGGIDVMVWRSSDLVAWGRTADPRAVTIILVLWKTGARIETASSAAAFLEIANEADTGPETDAVWRWFLGYGDDHLLPLARSVQAESVLRELLPIPSHGSLSLI